MPSAARQLHRRTAPRDRDEGGKMAWIVEHIEISRRPEDVFSYAIDFARFPEWQEGIVSVRREGNTPLAVGGPVTAIAKGAIEPLDDGMRSRVTIALEFEGHGIGKLLVPLVIRRQARKQLPKNEQKLREVLEHEA